MNSEYVTPSGDGLAARQRIEKAGREYLARKYQPPAEPPQPSHPIPIRELVAGSKTIREISLEYIRKSNEPDYPEPVAPIEPEHVFDPKTNTLMQPMLADIILMVCRVHGVSVQDIISIRRPRHIVLARQHYCWLAREYTDKSLPMISKALGGRDHTTAIHSISQFEKVMAGGTPYAYKKPWSKIREMIYEAELNMQKMLRGEDWKRKGGAVGARTTPPARERKERKTRARRT